MAKKRETSDFTDDMPAAEPTDAPQTLKSTSSIVNTPALRALLDSGIIEIVDGSILWREGHLEHVRREWADNPVYCERDYANELDVCRQYGVDL